MTVRVVGGIPSLRGRPRAPQGEWQQAGRTTWVQRLDTSGGTALTTPARAGREEVVPYRADDVLAVVEGGADADD